MLVLAAVTPVSASEDTATMSEGGDEAGLHGRASARGNAGTMSWRCH
jgi:hypothetical protein